MTDLHVRVWAPDDGTASATVVCVHGSMSSGVTNFSPQRPLVDDGYRLVVPDRRGYGASPDTDGEDFDRDADDIADLLADEDVVGADGAHLLGHSYGGVGALLAAARVPHLVRSLALTEPAAFAVAAADDAVEALLAEHRTLWAEAATLDDASFMERFVATMGGNPADLPDALRRVWTRRTRPMRLGRPAWEATIPVGYLATAHLPTLVVSGGHHPAFEAVCDALAEQLDARRETVRGAGHEIEATGERLNRVLLDFWRSL